MLLLHTPRPVPVSALIDAVWPDHPPATARGQVQNCISVLRRALGTECRITSNAAGYAIEVAAEAVDALEFERQLANGRRAAAAGRLDEAADQLRAALRLWRGQALTGIPGPPIEVAAARLEEVRLAATEELIEIDLNLGRHRDLVGELVALIAANPLRERLRGFLMVALYRCGRQAEALGAYRAAREEFVAQLGLEPGESLRQLQQAILARDASLDLDYDDADRSRQVTAGVLPTSPQQLPAAIADFTGRSALVEQVEATIREAVSQDRTASTVPIVVITGPGGVGKSTLAVQVSHRVRDRFPNGQLFAGLRGSGHRPVDPADVQARFLRALGVAPGQIGTGLDERSEMYRSLLATRRVLIVLDDAANEEQLAPLLPGMPGSAVLVTSRRRLAALPGARIVDIGVLDQAESATLLTGIVGADRAGCEPAALDRLIQLCGGLPLALRIVGAKLAARPHWRLADMVERLADERLRLDELAYRELDVRAAISVAYDGLSQPAQRLLRLLGVLDTPHFAVWTCVVLLGCDPLTAERLVDELVDVRLMEVESGHGAGARYRLHDLVRAFARERLHKQETPTEQTAALTRLLGGCLTLAEEAHRRVYGGDFTLLHGTGQRWRPDPAYLDRLLADPLSFFDAERQTLVTAVRQAAAADLDELCWDLAVTSVTLFEARGYYDDWRDTHELAIAATRRAWNLRGEAISLCSLGSLGPALPDPDARYRLRRALHLFRRLGERVGEALALRNLAYLDRMQGRIDAAVEGYRGALTGFHDAGDRVGEAHVRVSLAQVCLDRGDTATAEQLLDTAARTLQALGNPRVLAQISCRLGLLRLQQGRPVEAAATLHPVLETVRRSGDRIGEIHVLLALGETYTALRRFGLADELLTEALLPCQEVGGQQVHARVLLALGKVKMGMRNLSRAEDYLKRSAAMFQAIGARVWQARAIDALGEVHALAGQLPAAANAWAQAAQLAELPVGDVPEDGLAKQDGSTSAQPASKGTG